MKAATFYQAYDFNRYLENVQISCKADCRAMENTLKIIDKVEMRSLEKERGF